MAELLEVYDLKGRLLKTEKREKFYSESKEEFNKKGRISRQVKRIGLILMNSAGRVYLQKRSKLKNENPGLYDKTVGGHVLKGSTWDMAVVKECAEELGFPASILSPKDFDRSVRNTDLTVVGIFKKVDYIPNFKSVRITRGGERFILPYMTAIYIGYYDGAIRFIDGESSGVEVFSLNDLKEDIKNNPDKFTENIKFMIKKYMTVLKPIK